MAWTDLLKAAPDPQAIDAPGRMQAGAASALERQKAAIANQAEQLKFEQAKGLQEAFANGIDTVAGPPDANGRPTVRHEFNQEKFLSGLTKNPSAMAAYKEYAGTVFPQAQAEAAQKAVAETAGPGGGIDPTKVAGAMAANPLAAKTILETARGQQEAGYGSATKILPAKLGAAVMGVQSTPEAPLGSMMGNEAAAPQLPGMGGGGAKLATAADIDSLNSHDRAAKVLALANAGIPLKSTKSADIAAAVNQWQAANVGKALAKVDWFDPSSVVGGVMGIPSAQAEANTALTTGGNALQSAAQGIKAGGLGITDQEQTQDMVQQLRAQGFNANPGNVGQITEAKAAFDWLSNTSEHIDSLKKLVAKGAKIDDDTFANTISAMENAPMVAESISNMAGQKRFLEGIRTSPSYGALVKSADGNPIHFFRSLSSAKLGAQDQKTVLEQLGTIVDTQLETGKAKNDLEQFRMRKAWHAGLKEKPKAKGGARRAATAEDF